MGDETREATHMYLWTTSPLTRNETMSQCTLSEKSRGGGLVSEGLFLHYSREASSIHGLLKLNFSKVNQLAVSVASSLGESQQTSPEKH